MKRKGKPYRVFLALTAFLLSIIIFSSTELVVTAQSVSPTPVYVYLTNSDSNSISVIDTVANKVIGTIDVGDNPVGVAFNPDGTKAYVSNYGSNDISVINTIDNSINTTVKVGSKPIGVARQSKRN